MLGFGLHELKRAVGEYRVIAVGGKQLALAVAGGLLARSRTRRTINRPSVACAGVEVNAV
ncbi:hypothetical protein I546_7307 [Mycobacterium kansasii 732]|nr:hypothetical protein I546_7307 [Mycobacterium kansasii 732]